MFDLTYPFDPTGTAATNKVTAEFHTLQAPEPGSYHFFCPFSGPYFEDSMKVFRVSDNSELQRGQHWVPSFQFAGATRQAVYLYGGVTIVDRSISGQLRVEYQTIGGEWAVDPSKIADIILNLVVDPRAAYWEEVVGYPSQFPVINHSFDIEDLTGMADVVDSLGRIESAIAGRLVGNQKKGRYDVPPIRAVRNNAGNLVTLEESWTLFALVPLNLGIGEWVRDVAFEIIGARAEGVGAAIPHSTFYILMNRNAVNGVMLPDVWKRVDRTPAGAQLNLYGRIRQGFDSLNNPISYVEVWMKDTRLRGGFQAIDLTETSVRWVPVPYAENLNQMVLGAPAGIVPFVV